MCINSSNLLSSPIFSSFPQSLSLSIESKADFRSKNATNRQVLFRVRKGGPFSCLYFWPGWDPGLGRRVLNLGMDCYQTALQTSVHLPVAQPDVPACNKVVIHSFGIKLKSDEGCIGGESHSQGDPTQHAPSSVRQLWILLQFTCLNIRGPSHYWVGSRSSKGPGQQLKISS